MNKRELLKKIDELKQIHKMKTGGFVLITESDKGIEYINVNGKDYLDYEALAVLRTFTDDSIIIFDNIDDSWERRTISDDFKEMIFFPTVEDRMDYIRVNKGIKPFIMMNLIHTIQYQEKSGLTLTKIQAPEPYL